VLVLLRNVLKSEIAVAATVVLAAGLRLAGLTSKSLWFDETVSVFLAGQPVERLLTLVVANDTHPPLYYLLLRAWTALFSSGEAEVRALSVLISVLVVIVTLAFGRRLAGPVPALLAGLLVTVAPSQVAAGQEARMYGLLTLVSLVSWWALWEAVVSDPGSPQACAAGGGRSRCGGGREPAVWVTYATAAAAMLYTHYFGLFVLASQGAFLLVRRPTPGAKRLRGKLAMPSAVQRPTAGAKWRLRAIGVLGAVILFLPWVPAFALQLAGGRAWPEHRQPLGLNLPVDTVAAMTVGRPVVGPIVGPVGPAGTRIEMQGQPAARTPADGSDRRNTAVRWIAALGFAAAMALAAAGTCSRQLSRDARALLLCAGLLPLVLALGASLVRNIFAPRYMLFITPPIALLIGAGAAAFATSGRRIHNAMREGGGASGGGGAWPVALTVALVFVVILPNLLGLASFYRQPALDVFDWRKVARALAAQARDDDAVVFLPGFSRIPVDYYFRGPQLRLVLTPRGEDVEGPGSARMAEVVGVLARHPRVWILTVPPVPPAVGVLVESLSQQGFAVQRLQTVNMVRLILLEGKAHP
jgi:4-amino-4-deoxy-L-arabinose transferase-like glycosyltransferase